MRIVKEEIELKGFRQALVNESVALICFYAELENQLKKGKAIYEHECQSILDKIRKEMARDQFLGNSFPMIMGTGSNAGIVHYRPEK